MRLSNNRESAKDVRGTKYLQRLSALHEFRPMHACMRAQLRHSIDLFLFFFLLITLPSINIDIDILLYSCSIAPSSEYEHCFFCLPPILLCSHGIYRWCSILIEAILNVSHSASVIPLKFSLWMRHFRATMTKTRISFDIPSNFS